MSKLSKKEINKIKMQMSKVPDRGNTWVGLRPSVFTPKKLNKKVRRREDREVCEQYDEETYDDR